MFKCSFRSNILITSLKSKKSACFLVSKGYLQKWERIISKSSIWETRYWIVFGPNLVILPTPKNRWIASNRGKSLSCKPIANVALILYPVLSPEWGLTVIIKDPSKKLKFYLI